MVQQMEALADRRTDPLVGLMGAKQLREVILRDFERQLATEARNAGYTWAEIGGALGMTRQAAQEAYGRPSRPASAEREDTQTAAVPLRRSAKRA